MKFTYSIVVFLGLVSANEPVWSLRSVNDHRTDSTIQGAYGDHSINQANARPPYQSAMQMRHVKRDAYDADPESTGPYDDMEQHMKWDFGVPRGAPGSKSPFGEHHGSWVDMSWRNQANYGEAYDESVNKYPNEKL